MEYWVPFAPTKVPFLWMTVNLPYFFPTRLSEKRCDDKGNYYVVAFVKPHIKKSNPLNGPTVEFVSMSDGVELEDVDFRTIEMIDESMSMEDFWEMMQEYKNCVNFARQAILDSQEKN